MAGCTLLSGYKMDTKNLLFSVSTICESTPATNAGKPPDGSLVIHEDDWRQVEFVSHENLTHIQGELERLSTFKREQRSGPEWKSVYIRKEHPAPFLTVGVRLSHLPAFPRAELAIGSGPPGGGVVVGGFALSDEGDWFLYGQGDGNTIAQLAVSPGRTTASQGFVRAISQLAQVNGLILIDWQKVTFVNTTTPASVMAWAALCQQQ
jgi:hypothetical protein